MTLLGKNNLGAMIGLFVLITFGLLYCSSENSQKQQKAPISSSSDSLPNHLGADEAEVLITHYQDSQGEEIDDNFFFDGKMKEKDKVVSFRLNPKQATDFFEELDKLQKADNQPENNVRIRIWMAFRGENGHKLEKESNVAPLLELIVDDKNPSGNFYPLRPFKSNFIPLFKTLYGDTPKQRLKSIPSEEAHVLVENWDTIPVNDITKQLYQDNDEVSGGRIEYYTFDVNDTEAIYQYQKKLAGTKKPCYFYIHLGQLQERGYAALRTIIHLDDNPIKIGTMTDDQPPYFEFAAQCPPICQ